MHEQCVYTWAYPGTGTMNRIIINKKSIDVHLHLNFECDADSLSLALQQLTVDLGNSTSATISKFKCAAEVVDANRREE